MTLSKLDQVLKQRAKKYEDAWKVSGSVAAEIANRTHRQELWKSRYLILWTKIWSKLVRAIYQPEDTDNWIDIIGYAKLALQWAEEADTNADTATHVQDLLPMPELSEDSE